MITIDAGLSHFYLAYGIIGLVTGLTVVVLLCVSEKARENIELDFGGHEVHPLIVLILSFSLTFYLWPVALAIILKGMNDDDGPWKG